MVKNQHRKDKLHGYSFFQPGLFSFHGLNTMGATFRNTSPWLPCIYLLQITIQNIFYAAVSSTFARFFPGIKARYDYGVLIFILTFSLVAVSGYRVNDLVEMAHQRLSTIAIGSSTCVLISIFVCPVWAGEELQEQVALNIEKLAKFLEGTKTQTQPPFYILSNVVSYFKKLQGPLY